MRNGTASTRNFTLACTALAAAGLLAVGGSALASDEAGTIKTLKGTASVERGGQITPAAVGGKVLVSDRILTGPESSIGITLRDNTLLSAGANSTLVLNRFAFDSTTHTGALDATVKRGTLAVVSGKIAKASPDNVIFNTPSVALGVRGTEFIIDAGQRDGDK
ncbi:MAG: FecR domain-containing protein [Propionivibrio sp.]|uniref:FecR domain-containing protein n=1 Tax=Candidatus Propionivibrio dominans TaxID=2954373 RepID=A0A9D7FDU4_9RHOO|nr:FecR domain-containing protein [Candidatus Propionivibrio dominans]MBL0168076.1 FecR domain-containing protein [Propionivibrio sp.]